MPASGPSTSIELQPSLLSAHPARSPSHALASAYNSQALQPSYRMSVDTSVRIVVLASHAYAAIKGPGFALDVQLSPGRSAQESLRQSAAADREAAAALLKRSLRLEAAATSMDLSRPTVLRAVA